MRSKRRIKKAKKAVAEDKGEFVMQSDLNEVFVGPVFDFTVRGARDGVSVVFDHFPERSLVPFPHRKRAVRLEIERTCSSSSKFT